MPSACNESVIGSQYVTSYVPMFSKFLASAKLEQFQTSQHHTNLMNIDSLNSNPKFYFKAHSYVMS